MTNPPTNQLTLHNNTGYKMLLLLCCCCCCCCRCCCDNSDSVGAQTTQNVSWQISENSKSSLPEVKFNDCQLFSEKLLLCTSLLQQLPPSATTAATASASTATPPPRPLGPRQPPSELSPATLLHFFPMRLHTTCILHPGL